MLAAVLAVVGCSAEKPIKVQPPAALPAAASAKALLEEVAQTGQRGSGLAQLRADLQQVKEADTAKGDALMKELDALEKAPDPETVKAKAKAMADQL